MTTYRAGEEELRAFRDLDASIRRNQDRLDEAAGWDYGEEDEEEKLGHYMTEAERQAYEDDEEHPGVTYVTIPADGHTVVIDGQGHEPIYFQVQS